MPRTPLPIRIEGIASFRLRRHHLLDHEPADAVTICRDVCGVQAQMMSAAYLQLWTRNHALTRTQIETALWKSRTLVKTSLMRQTLHLIPADEFPLYITALKSCRVAQALRVMARCGIEREEGEALTPLIMEALSAGPLGRAAIDAAVRPKVSKRVRGWMEKVWSIVRLPVAEGLVCYGAGENNEVSFIRMDQWLPNMKTKPIHATEAQRILFRKYLAAYGPARLSDFSHWSGISMQEVRGLRSLLAPGMVELPGDKKGRFLLPKDRSKINENSGGEACVRLLPHFDSYLLAHREKDHLLAAKHYKHVYRNQGWISPVVLIGGAVAGVWSCKVQNKKLLVRVEPFGKLSPSARAGIERQAEDLSHYFGSELDLRFT
jgi:hypothetical protein